MLGRGVGSEKKLPQRWRNALGTAVAACGIIFGCLGCVSAQLEVLKRR